ncbi:TolB amino-terminal domain-containing protein [Bosea sp. OK403]|uniref:winged helix-turn-helix domain-containing tetratricopeptide repeat protein n=1 Tax=Bosea sp. OK403 TaxID=1855286 RepID=UPI0008E3EBB7|nr:winged helix-turn-helix domain-containing tetratricopeptide repeat protein [Bosea sp. OK403]SFH94168.1 TolB amino-terminal domain-containing protein [Bosea sp. OK403]
MRFVFGEHVLDAGRRELSRAGSPVAIEPQVFDLLLYLLRNRDRMVSKDEVLDSVWHGRIVAESSLTTRMNAARKAVGDSGEAQSVIRTVPRKGFRFVAEVQEHAPPVAHDVLPASAASEPAVKPALALPEKPSIALLPFDNMGGDPEQDYFADGLVEDITTALSRLRWLFVIARNSSFAYKGRAVDIRDVGRELGVRYVLEGSVRTSGTRMRLNVQLIEAESGRHIWADRYDRPMDDIFALQDEITERVVAAIEPSIYAEEGYRAQMRHDRPEAWGLAMRAWTLINRLRRADAYEAMELLRQALEIEPDYARAHAFISWAMMIGVQCGWYRDADVGAAIIEHAFTAKRLDPDEPWSCMTYAFVLGAEGRHGEAIAEARRTMEVVPNFALGRAMFAWMLIRAGHFDEAVSEAERARRLNPVGTFSGFYSLIFGFALLAARRFEEALQPLLQALTEFPEWSSTYNCVASVYGHLGRIELAQPVLERQRQVAPHMCLGLLRQRLAKFAHTPTLLEGLAKAGMRE